MREKVTEAQLQAALAWVLGVSEEEASFHTSPDHTGPDQHAIVRDIVDRKDVLAVIPTGGGKSVCYQVPALCLPGITLVVSPLVALIQNQGETLYKRDVPVACLAGGFLLDREGPHSFKEERGAFLSRWNRVYNDAANGDYKILYVTPERLQTRAFLRFAQYADISLIAVDEAHCISLWGYDFRPSYLAVSHFMKRLGYHPMVAAFTATATPAVCDDVRYFLAMKNPREYKYAAARKDLELSVRRFRSPAEKLRFINEFVREHAGQAGIVYCSTKPSVDKVYSSLKAGGADVLRYYADLDDGGKEVTLDPGESKEANRQRFMEGDGLVTVSTTALGMGIDKSDLRFVIHYELPISLENYFQEAGRAGRDGKGGSCVLCYLPEDEKICHRLIERSIGQSTLDSAAKEVRRRVAGDKLRDMVRYCGQKGGDALARYIRNYFDSPAPAANEAEAQAVRKAMLARVNEIGEVYANYTKVAGALREGHMCSEGLRVSNRKASPPLTVSYRVDGPALTYFDMMVADAAYTLMKNRVSTITAKGIMELLSGDPGLTLRPERRAAVEESLRKMMACRIDIDRSRSVGYGFVYDKQGDRRHLSGPFLPLTEKRSGFGYDPHRLPPLYEYAEILGDQFCVLPTGLLNVPGLPTRAENLAIAWYLLLRIGSMERRPRRSMTSRVIKMKTMLETLGVRMPEDAYERKRKLASLMKKERKVLEHLRASGLIGNFSPSTGRPEDVTVDLPLLMDEFV